MSDDATATAPHGDQDRITDSAAACSHPNARPWGPEGWRDNAGRSWRVCPDCNEQWPEVPSPPPPRPDEHLIGLIEKPRHG